MVIKEDLVKKIDILRDELKWWMNVLLIVMTSLVGGAFSISQNSLVINFMLIILIFLLLVILFYSSVKINKLQKELKRLLRQLKKEK